MKLRDLIKQIYLSSGKFYSNATADEDLKHFILKNRPRSVGKELIRIGGRGDGGYLIPNDLDGISACFSPGIAASSTFEEELADKYGIKSFMADYSVDHPPISHDLFHFEKKVSWQCQR